MNSVIHVGVSLQEALLLVHSTLVGVTTQDLVHQQAPIEPDRARHVRSFHRSTLHALQELVQAAGLDHPQEVNARL